MRGCAGWGGQKKSTVSKSLSPRSWSSKHSLIWCKILWRRMLPVLAPYVDNADCIGIADYWNARLVGRRAIVAAHLGAPIAGWRCVRSVVVLADCFRWRNQRRHWCFVVQHWCHAPAAIHPALRIQDRRGAMHHGAGLCYTLVVCLRCSQGSPNRREVVAALCEKQMLRGVDHRTLVKLVHRHCPVLCCGLLGCANQWTPQRRAPNRPRLVVALERWCHRLAATLCYLLAPIGTGTFVFGPLQSA